MLNHCTFIGNLGRDPEIRSTQSGDKIANLSLACTERWKNRNGEQQERTEWVRVVIFGKLADIAERYLAKGSKVYIAGKMQTRKWQDQSGQDRYSTEIVLSGFDAKMVMLDSPRDQERRTQPDGGGFNADGPEYDQCGDLNDDLPF